jgi:hypothetical protein
VRAEGGLDKAMSKAADGSSKPSFGVGLMLMLTKVQRKEKEERRKSINRTDRSELAPGQGRRARTLKGTDGGGSCKGKKRVK